MATSFDPFASTPTATTSTTLANATTTWPGPTLAPTWTQPLACLTPIPSAVAGTCSYTTCSPFSQNFAYTNAAMVNDPVQTAPGLYTSASCMPPGYQVAADPSRGVLPFSGVGCPSAWVTASTFEANMTSAKGVICCPSQYPNWGTRLSPLANEASCFATSTMQYGQVYHAVATGLLTTTITATQGLSTIASATSYSVESWIAPRAYPSSQAVEVYHPAIRVVVPSSDSAPSHFSLFGQSLVISIVITVAIVIGGLIALWCLCGCCMALCDDSDDDNRRRRQRRRPSPPLPLHEAYTPSTMTTPTPSIAECQHGRLRGCNNKGLAGKECCACKDKRPASTELSKNSRILDYCTPCWSSWRYLSDSECPVAWRATGGPSRSQPAPAPVHFPAPAPPPAPAPAPAPTPAPAPWPPSAATTPCSHSLEEYCMRFDKIRKQCCACKDTRTTALAKSTRIEGYCLLCRLHWVTRPTAMCPPEWKLEDVNCPHKRSQACEKVKGAEASCCACKDTRTAKLSKNDRIMAADHYCGSCRTHWKGLPLDQLPGAWNLACTHGDKGKQCTFASTGVGCCACSDNSTGEVSKADRLRSYCEKCRQGWEGASDLECPREWKLKCKHGRAYTWEAQVASASAREGMCCCACRDTRPAELPRLVRMNTYCQDCRTYWRAVPFSDLPEEWKRPTGRTSTIGGPSTAAAVTSAAAGSRSSTTITTSTSTTAGSGLSGRSSMGASAGGSKTVEIKIVAKVEDNGDPLHLHVEFTTEPSDTHEKQFDEGPRYGPRRLGDENPETTGTAVTVMAVSRLNRRSTAPVTPAAFSPDAESSTRTLSPPPMSPTNRAGSVSPRPLIQTGSTMSWPNGRSSLGGPGSPIRRKPLPAELAAEVPQGGANNGESASGSGTAAAEVGNEDEMPGSGNGKDVDYSGYDEETGPVRGAPRLSVPATVWAAAAGARPTSTRMSSASSLGVSLGSSSRGGADSASSRTSSPASTATVAGTPVTAPQPASTAGPTGVEKPGVRSSAMTPDQVAAERQRKKDQEGLQYGRPKFQVPPS